MCRHERRLRASSSSFLSGSACLSLLGGAGCARGTVTAVPAPAPPGLLGPVPAPPFGPRSVSYARHGMVAAAHPLAMQIGVDVLKRGRQRRRRRHRRQRRCSASSSRCRAASAATCSPSSGTPRRSEALRPQRVRAARRAPHARTSVRAGPRRQHPDDAARCPGRCPAPSTAGARCTTASARLPHGGPARAGDRRTPARGFPVPRDHRRRLGAAAPEPSQD